MNKKKVITLLIGHRGVGKTSLLKRIALYHQMANLGPCDFYDLDEEIIKSQRKSINDLFSQDGEVRFREIEEQTLLSLVKRICRSSYIALGAGYQGGIPSLNSLDPSLIGSLEILWVRRINDSTGRIFFNRPRLDLNLSPTEEYLSRFKERENRYQNQCTQQLILREGDYEFDPGEFAFFTGNYTFDNSTDHFSPDHLPMHKSGCLTLDAQMNVQSNSHVFKLPIQRIELRDDLLDQKFINDLIQKHKPHTFLYSHRSLLKEQQIGSQPTTPHWVDWPLELGPPPFDKKSIDIISAHEHESEHKYENENENENQSNQNLSYFLNHLELQGNNKILKAAPLIETFTEILIGYEWQQQSPSKRSFLPRSPSGRWKWFRQFMKGKMPLNFFRIDEGSAPDQPTLLEWLNTPPNPTHFAAVIGSPVSHSYTPTEQREFFSQLGLPVFSIEIKDEEFHEAFSVLQRLGLKAAAVTSPLKNRAFQVCHQLTEIAQTHASVNTLYLNQDGQVRGHNTDLEGFSHLIAQVEIKSPVVLWGGGGTLPIMKQVLPHALPFSARTGKIRDGNGDGDGDHVHDIDKDITCSCSRSLSRSPQPHTLIWAAGKNQPPLEWQPQIVVDLNYTECSPGKEYALLRGCQYINGLKMFKAQAKLQREFWAPLFAEEVQ